MKDGSDVEAIKKASEELSTEMQKIGEAVSKAAPAADAEHEIPKEDQETAAKDAEFKEGEKPEEGEAPKA